MNAHPIFSADQRDELEKLELCQEQISRLESVLPLCRALLSKPATLRDVREGLAVVLKPLRQAMKKLDALANRPSTANKEAFSRIELAGFEMRNDTDSTGKAIIALTRIVDTVDYALKSLPTTQRRAHDADPRPIGLIERALLKGFCDHFTPPFPPYRLKTSLTKPPFPDIAAICYEAIGRSEAVPERAIRAYQKLRRGSRSRPESSPATRKKRKARKRPEAVKSLKSFGRNRTRAPRKL